MPIKKPIKTVITDVITFKESERAARLRDIAEIQKIVDRLDEEILALDDAVVVL